MRSRLRSWIFALVGLGCCASARAGLVDRIVAILDRDVITLSEAEEARRLDELRTGAPAPPLVDVVETLVETRLVEREVERFGAEPVPEALVDDAEARLRESFPSVAAFEEALRERGLEEETLRDLLRRQLAVNAYLERRFRALTYVTDEEVERYVETELLPDLPAGAESIVTQHEDEIRRLLAERKFNERVDRWVDELKARVKVRLYVW